MNDDELRQLFQEARQDLNTAIDGLRREFTGALGETQNTLRDEFRTAMGELRRENAAEHLETRHHFDRVSESLESKIELVAESVVMVNQKLDRELADVRHEMRMGFADTHNLIKFTFSNLAR